MRVLVACEFSGVVREAFKKRGHDVWSCDLLPTRIEGNHIQGDVLSILNDGWDLMIGHPPCTYLSKVATSSLYPGGKLNKDRYELGKLASNFFYQLYEAPIKKICLENPTPFKVFDLPKHTQVIQPYYFGEPFQKRTLLWLKELPKLIPTLIVPKVQSTRVASWYNQGKGFDRQQQRSVTFQGIATAMAEQWG